MNEESPSSLKENGAKSDRRICITLIPSFPLFVNNDSWNGYARKVDKISSLSFSSGQPSVWSGRRRKDSETPPLLFFRNATSPLPVLTILAAFAAARILAKVWTPTKSEENRQKTSRRKARQGNFEEKGKPKGRGDFNGSERE